MSWVAVGVTAAGAVKGSMDANRAAKQQRKHDAYRKAAIQYSPWTGMGDPGAGNFGNTDALSGALGGGLQGFAMGSSINGMMGAAKPTPTQTQVPAGTQMSAMNTYQPAQQMQGMGASQSPWAGMKQPPAMARQNQIDFIA